MFTVAAINSVLPSNGLKISSFLLILGSNWLAIIIYIVKLCKTCNNVRFGAPGGAGAAGTAPGPATGAPRSVITLRSLNLPLDSAALFMYVSATA